MGDLQRAGIELVAEGAASFNSAIENANSLLAGMGEQAQGASSGIDVLGEIATGALRKIGELAVEGIGKLGSALVDFVKDAMEGEKLIARLNSVITATGGAAGLTLTDAQKLADQFRDMAGGSDEAVLAIEEMALRMGTVSGKDMPAFIQTTLDLAAATGTDATNAARILAQAYDDPASAMARFNKMGIRFDSELQDQIKAMMKSGDTAGAFALMLGRVSEATAGAAAGQADTLSGQLGIMQEHLLDAGKAIGESFLPFLKILFEDFIKPGIPIIESFAGTVATFVTDMAGGLQHLIDVILGGGLNDYLSEFGNIFAVIGDTLSGTSNPALQFLSDLFTNFGIWIMPVTNAMGNLGAVFQSIMTFIQPVIDAVSNLAATFMASWPQIQAMLQNTFSSLMSQMGQAAPSISANLTAIRDTVVTTLGNLTAFWEAHGAQIIAVIDFVMPYISTTIVGTLTLISGIFTAIMQALSGNWTGAWETIKNTVETFLQLALNIVGVKLEDFQTTWKYNWDNAGTVLSIVWTQMKDAVAKFVMDLTSGIQAFIIDVVNKFNGFVAQVKAVFAIDWGAVGKSIIDGIAAGITNAVGGLVGAATNAAMSAYNAAKSALGIESPSKLFYDIGTQTMLGMGQGITQNASVPSLAAAGASMTTASTAYNVTNNWNYSPSYGGAPYAPSTDFAIMQVMAG